MRRTQRKVLSILLSLAMLCGLAMPAAFATDSRYNDTTDHWAETAIERWSDYGIIEGYGNAFNPDDAITRGQMATILAKTLGLTETAENPFTDISADDWFTPYVLRCYTAGIMLGDNGKAYPDNEITRQEAMTMFCRAFEIQADETAALTDFNDGEKVADWALPYVSALITGGIVSGVSSDTIAPNESMSRAALVTILDRAVVQYINASGEYDLIDNSGIILVSAGDITLKGETKADILITAAADGKAVTFKDGIVTGAIAIQADNVSIIKDNATIPEISGEGVKVEDKTETEAETPAPTKKPSSGGGGGGSSSRPSTSNLTISEEKTVNGGTYNNVTITESVADGEVTLSGVTVKGDLTIKGGGSSSVKLIDCTINGKIIMAKENGEAPRLELTNTPVATVEVQKPAIIEAADAVSAVAKIEATANIEIKGESTKVETLVIPETAETAVAVTVTSGTVATVEAKAETSVSGASNSVSTIIATAAVTADSATVQKVEIPETATESVSVTITGDSAVDIEVNCSNGAAITGDNVTISTDLETVPDNITVDGVAVTHIHKWGEPTVTDATCEEDGDKVYTCVAEGCSDPAITKTEVVTKLGHKYGEWKEGEKGFHIRECANDIAHIEQAGHAWDEGKITTEASCGQDGIKTYTCSVCKATETETIPKPDHNWGEWKKVDTTNHKRVCKNNAEHTETAEHTPIIDAEIEATCTEQGKTEGSHCDVCKGVIVEQNTVEPSGHDFTGGYQKDADGHWHICTRDNCTETDTKSSHTYNTTNCAEAAICTDCSYEKAAGEHTWGAWEQVDNTNHKHTCSSCLVSETAEHAWNEGEITTEPTETTEGVKTFTCGDCGATKTEAVPVVGGVKITLVQDGDNIKATWTTTDAPNYYFMFADAEGTLSGGWWVDGVCEIPNLLHYLPRVDTGGTYSFVLYAGTENYAKGEELARLENCFDITVSGEAMSYEMTFNNPEDGEHTITLGTAIPANIYHISAWYRNNRITSMGAGKSSYDNAVGSTFTENKSSIQDGDIYDLRLLTSYTLDEQTIKATMTPASLKTYTETVEKSIWLELDGNDLNLMYTDGVGLGDNEWYYFIENGTELTSDTSTCIDITWYLKDITESTTKSYEIKKGTWASKTTLCKLDNAVAITVTDNVPDISLVPLASGDYQFSSASNQGYFYQVKAPGGDSICTAYSADGIFSCGIYEGCTVEVRLCSISVAQDGLSAEISMSQIITIETPTLCTSSNEEIEVDTAEKLTDAVKAGATAVLTADISSDEKIYFNTGAPAGIKLNGHKIVTPTLHIGLGKTVTIDGSVQGSQVVGRILINHYSNVTLSGGSYDYMNIWKARNITFKNIEVQTSEATDTVIATYCGEIVIENSKFTNNTDGEYSAGLYIADSDTVSLVNVTSGATGAYSYGADIAKCGQVNITGGEYVSKDTSGLRIINSVSSVKDATITSDSSCAFIAQDGADVEINGGTFNSAIYYVIQLSGNNTKVTINDGIYTCVDTNSVGTVAATNTDSIFTVNGGTFNVDPTEYVNTTTHTVTDNGDGTYTVTEIVG